MNTKKVQTSSSPSPNHHDDTMMISSDQSHLIPLLVPLDPNDPNCPKSTVVIEGRTYAVVNPLSNATQQVLSVSTTKLCSVCSDQAVYVFYGALTCDSCR